MKTIELVSGYDQKKKTPEKTTYRVITLEEVKSWTIPIVYASRCTCGHLGNSKTNTVHTDTFQPGHGPCMLSGCECTKFTWAENLTRDITPSHVWFIANDGTARQAKVNGKVRTWKRDVNRVELPLKYGMYEFRVFNAQDIEAGRLLMPM